MKDGAQRPVPKNPENSTGVRPCIPQGGVPAPHTANAPFEVSNPGTSVYIPLQHYGSCSVFL